MKIRIFAIGVIILASCISNGQINLVREGIAINNTQTGSWYGDIISRTAKTNLVYQNNSISSVNTEGYMILAGDEGPGSTNNNLDNAKFVGNKLSWNGVNGSSVITHGLFTGYNKNLVVKYNFLENVPYGIIFKSGTDEGTNMTFTSGGCSYNICKNGKFAVRLKGMNGLKIYNNTFYSGDNAGWYLVLITSNADRTLPAPSLGTEIFNNIFYSTSRIPMISVEEASLSNFTCDYNVYWCTSGEPTFLVGGKSVTWAQWQAKGFDLHSKILDPQFINTTDFVPSNRLDFGKDLGTDWQTGLSTNAKWQAGVNPATTNQNGKWQVGARIYNATSISQIVVGSTSGASTINNDGGSLQLFAQIFPDNADNKSVTWSVSNGVNRGSVNSSGLVTALANGIITVRATANDGSNIYGELNISITNQKVLVQSISVSDNLANDTIKGLNKSIELIAVIEPVNATNKSVEWSLENITGKATIDTNGLLTTIAPGKVKVIVKTSDGSLLTAEKQYIIAFPTTVNSEIELNHFSVYPNPSNGIITVEFAHADASGFWMEIADLFGNVIEKQQLNAVVQSFRLPQLLDNIYVIKISGKGFVQSKKLVVLK